MRDDPFRVLAPAGGGTFPRKEDRLTGTGTTEDLNTTALTVGPYATLLVGNVAVRVVFNNDSTATGQVATTAPIIAANTRFDWEVELGTRYVHIEAADGSSVYEAWVWQSST